MNRFVLMMLLVSGVAQAGELFRWVDNQGKVHYGDESPMDVEQVETKMFPDPKVDNNYIPYETRRAQKNFPVTLFVTETCGDYCEKGRELLRGRGIPYMEKVLVTEEEFDVFRQASGDKKVPTLKVGRSYVTEYNSEKWRKELDAAGYPRVSNYRQPEKISDSVDAE